PGRTPTIGRPSPCVTVTVLDLHRRPVPVGVSGELAVGVAGVARGYLNRPELEAERFLPDPDGGGRLYLTGDRVRWLRSGELEYLGRGDAQVKVRGFRIEPGEVEAAILEHPGVVRAAVAARDQALVGYVVPAAGWVGDEVLAALRQDLRARLPDHLVPSRLVLVDDLPLTPSGKLDRAALPEVDWAQAFASDKFIAPRTPTERAIAREWCALLGLRSVGVRDKFFDVGGTSLLLVDLSERLELDYPGTVSVAQLFEHNTVEAIAKVVDESSGAGL